MINEFDDTQLKKVRDDHESSKVDMSKKDKNTNVKWPIGFGKFTKHNFQAYAIYGTLPHLLLHHVVYVGQTERHERENYEPYLRVRSLCNALDKSNLVDANLYMNVHVFFDAELVENDVINMFQNSNVHFVMNKQDGVSHSRGIVYIVSFGRKPVCYYTGIQSSGIKFPPMWYEDVLDPLRKRVGSINVVVKGGLIPSEFASQVAHEHFEAGSNIFKHQGRMAQHSLREKQRNELKTALPHLPTEDIETALTVLLGELSVAV